MKNLLENISNEIRSIRVKKKITQQELAEKTNLSVPYISQIENNHRNITLDTFIKIAQALDISLSDFFLPYSKKVDPSTQKLLTTLNQSKNKEALSENILNLINLIDKDKNN